MFCSQCGSQINDGALFCAKCGARIGGASVQPQQAPVQPQVQPQQTPVQPQTGQVYVQPQAGQTYVQPQPQVQPVYVQPQTQPQQVVYVQPQVQPQPQVVVQPQPQAVVQPQPQVVVQPQPQAVVQPQPQVVVQPQAVVQPQPQVAVQPQAVVQPQPQVIVQPQVQTDANGTNASATPKKKKKSPVAGIIIGVIAAAVVFAALIIGIVKSGVLKSPKKVFAENAVGVFENINKELPNIGMSPAESLLHLTIDDTKDSHTTTTTTSFYSDNEEAAAYESLELVQSYSYDADKGNAAYDFSVTSGGTPAGTGAIYFDGDEFIFSPMGAASPMVRYTLDNDAVGNYKKLSAIDRYALMIQGKSKEDETDWNEALKNFTAYAIKDIDKKSFVKSKEDIMIFNKVVSSKVVSVEVKDDDAINLINGVSDLVYSGVEDEKQKEKIDLFQDLCEDYERNGGNLNLIMKTYSYKNKPVIVRMEADLSGKPYSYEIGYYEKGKEKELNVSSTADGKNTRYADSVISAGLGQYQYTTQYDDGDNSLTIEKKGYMLGNNREVNGTLEYTSKSGIGDGTVPIQDEAVTGTINETILMGNGVSTTVINNGPQSITITTEVTRESLQSGKITPPMFLEESGVDCATLEELKEAVKIKEEDSIPAVNNSLTRLGQVYALMSRNGLMESLK